MKFLQKRQNERSFTKSDYVVLSYEQLLQVNGAGGSSSGGGGPSISIPTKPENVNLDKNVEKAKDMTLSDFYNSVRNNGEWDYKQQGSEYQDFGNFNYGVTGKAAGIPDQILLRGAGWAQEQAGTSKEEWNSWWGTSPYGDDPKDQEQIKAGIAYYNENYK